MSEEVDELTEGMGGKWLVTTQGSSHEWDLDNMTYKRIPGPESRAGAMSQDGDVMRITRVDRYPKVGNVSFVWYDDPSDFVIEHWRQSSTIVSIVKMEEMAE